LEKSDAAILARRARKLIEGLEEKPAIVAVNVRGELAAPFWNQQVGWDSDRYLARFGHRYLSVHYIRQDGGRYTRFNADALNQLRSRRARIKRAPVRNRGAARKWVAFG
jgi:hypothetical protein